MRKARGFGIIKDPSFSCDVEVETATCCHCQWTRDRVPYKGMADDDKNGRPIGAWCTCCDAYMCLRCVGKPCTPIERWLERQETRRNYDEVMK